MRPLPLELLRRLSGVQCDSSVAEAPRAAGGPDRGVVCREIGGHENTPDVYGIATRDRALRSCRRAYSAPVATPHPTVELDASTVRQQDGRKDVTPTCVSQSRRLQSVGRCPWPPSRWFAKADATGYLADLYRKILRQSPAGWTIFSRSIRSVPRSLEDHHRMYAWLMRGKVSR